VYCALHNNPEINTAVTYPGEAKPFNVCLTQRSENPGSRAKYGPRTVSSWSVWPALIFQKLSTTTNRDKIFSWNWRSDRLEDGTMIFRHFQYAASGKPKMTSNVYEEGLNNYVVNVKN